MAKKQKRQISRGTAPAVVERPPVQPNGDNSASRYPVSTSRANLGSAEFKPDYSYVTSDLKRIGILAGSFIAVLVVLSFFLR